LTAVNNFHMWINIKALIKNETCVYCSSLNLHCKPVMRCKWPSFLNVTYKWVHIHRIMKCGDQEVLDISCSTWRWQTYCPRKWHRNPLKTAKCFFYNFTYLKGKEPQYKSGEALRFPLGWSSHISRGLAYKGEGFELCAPAVFIP